MPSSLTKLIPDLWLSLSLILLFVFFPFFTFSSSFTFFLFLILSFSLNPFSSHSQSLPLSPLRLLSLSLPLPSPPPLLPHLLPSGPGMFFLLFPASAASWPFDERDVRSAANLQAEIMRFREALRISGQSDPVFRRGPWYCNLSTGVSNVAGPKSGVENIHR